MRTCPGKGHLPFTSHRQLSRLLPRWYLSPQYTLCCLFPPVPTMQSAQTRQRDYGCFRSWLLLDRSAIGRVFAEAIVNSVFVMVVHVIARQPTEMRFVECDHVIEDLAPATSHPSLRDSILPRCSYARSFGFQPGCLQERDHLVIEFRIAIEDDIPIQTSLREGLAQLLDDPLG
jgi:hypothetical protein